MLRYRDSGATDTYPARWFDTNVVDGVQSFRGQFGFYRFKTLRKYQAVLKALSEAHKTINLILGSNATDPLTDVDLRKTLEVIGSGDTSHLVVVSYSNALFHPKVAHVVGSDGAAHGFVGSANLTVQAFGKNVEAWVEIDQSEATTTALNDIAGAIDSWIASTAAGVFQIKSETDISDLIERKIVVTESKRRERMVRTREGTAATGRGSRSQRWSVPTEASEAAPDDEESDDITIGGAAIPPPITVVTSAPGTAPSVTPPTVIYRWSKLLSDSDVNKNAENERNLMSMGVGRGKYNRVLSNIDNIYNIFFASEPWTNILIRGRQSFLSSVEITVRFDGQPDRQERLQVVHAPHRGSGQNNYHTSIRWNTAMSDIFRSAPGTGFTGYWAVLDKLSDGKYVLQITSVEPVPRGIGL